MALEDDAETLANALGRAAEASRQTLRHAIAHGHLGEPGDTRPETDEYDPVTHQVISLGKRAADGTYRSPGKGAPPPDLDAIAKDLALAQQALTRLGNTVVPTPQEAPASAVGA